MPNQHRKDTTPLLVRLDDDVVAAVRVAAVRNGETVKALVLRALLAELDRGGLPPLIRDDTVATTTGQEVRP